MSVSGFGLLASWVKCNCTPNRLWFLFLNSEGQAFQGASSLLVQYVFVLLSFVCVNHGFSPTLIEAFWGVLPVAHKQSGQQSQISSCPCQLKESAKRAKEQGHNLKPNASCGLLQVYRITPSIIFKVQMIWACSNMFQLQNSEFMECSTSKSSKKEFQPVSPAAKRSILNP